MHTPGHTPGSTCWQVEDSLFAGDTVFVNACGRCDLRGGNPELMFESLRRISGLDPSTRLYPGHDYGDVPVSTVGRERGKNPYFGLLASLPEFVAYRMRPRR
jgi:glyoxylase-like metal-dependent hydrolase (beta-lactamase superfamily II)